VAAVTVRSLRPGEEPAAAVALCDAFDRDLLARWIYPEARRRRDRMGSMFTELVTDPPPGAVIDVTDDLDAVAIWQPPGSDVHRPPPPDTAEDVVRLFGAVGTAMPAQPFGYLMFLGSRTPGVGNGSALLRHRLALVEGPTALWTGSPANVAFYESHRFRVLSRHDAVGASAWWMLRD